MLLPVLMCASFSHTIHRPYIPFELGVRLIHTPETFLLLKPEAHFVSLFRLDGSEPPAFLRDSDYSSVQFRFHHCSHHHSHHHSHHDHDELVARMLTNKQDESNIVVLQKNRPICTMALSVSRDKLSGHKLRFDGQLYGQNELWRQQLKLIVTGLMLDSMCSFVVAGNRLCIGQTTGKHYSGASMVTEDGHLRAYRAAVLKLPLRV